MKIEESVGNVYRDLGLENADDMLIKSKYVATLASLIESADIGKYEAAKRFGLTLENLQVILRGKLRDEPVSTIADYLAKLSEATGSPP